jgi:hypothetical protein
MRTKFLILVAVYFISLITYGQHRTIKFSELTNKDNELLEPFENVDIDQPILSLTISEIPSNEIDEVLNDLYLLDSLGSRKSKIEGQKKSSTSLYFELAPVAGAMTNPVKIIYIKYKTKVLANFNIKVKETSEPTNPLNLCEISQSQFQYNANAFVKAEISRLGLRSKDGVLIDTEQVVHVFIDHYGKLYGNSVPTSSKEEYRYQLHVITSNCHVDKFNFSFSYTGSYEPEFNVYNTFETEKKVTPQSAKELKYLSLDYAVIGPFTGQFTLKLDREDAPQGTNRKTLLDTKVNVAKRYYVSIAAGLFGSGLRNPSSIEKFALAPGDTTLVADDYNRVRGVFTVVATFYPAGRSFLFPPKGSVIGPERLGFIVGAQLNDKLEENFFGGLSFDVARGLSLTTGLHFGRRNYVVGHQDFEFGTDKFEGELKIKKEWAAGLFVGVIVDARVVGQLFPGFVK